MEIRNMHYNEDGSIDCELDHPDAGWIPFTARKDDPMEHGRLIFDAIKDKAAPYQAEE